MSAFCGCFRSSPQVTESGGSARRSRGNRNSIIKGQNREMDLLELNKRGMDGVAEDDEEWQEGDDYNHQIRASRQTELNEENKVSFILPYTECTKILAL